MAEDVAIETDRLILRAWRESDRTPFAAICADPEVMRHFPATLSREESDALIDRVSGHIAEHGFGLWAVERREDGALLGFVGMQIVNFASPIEGEIEIGWRLDKAFWRQGHAREAAQACLDWFEANRAEPRVVSMTIADNRPSWALMEKLGFERRPDLDFDHPRVEAGTRCCPQIVYVKEYPR